MDQAPPTTELELLTPRDSVKAVDGSHALTILRTALVHLHRLAEQHRGNPYATGAATVYLTQLAADLRSVLGDLKVWTNEAMPAKRLEIPGIGIIEKAGEGNNDHWDDRRTLQAIMAWALETGAMDGPQDVPDLILRFANIGYFKKTELKEAGIVYGPAKDKDGAPVEGSELVTTTKGVKSIKVVTHVKH